MIAIIGLSSLVGIAVSILMLIISVIRRRSIKKHLICTCAFVFLFLIFVSLPSNNSSSGESTQSETNNEELTPEEQAAELQEVAIKYFAESKYQKGIESCAEIVTNYPDTEIAASIKDFVYEQFEQYIHISAKELMSEYDDNLVNADKEYTDKVVVVTGTVDSIDKTNGDKNLVVLLNSGTYFKGVQLNFDTSHEDAIAELRKGDSVKAIGKCTGLSGKVLLVIDGTNVMIENCYLLE